MQKHVVFLPIGDKQCGDAIAIRFGEIDPLDPSKQFVIVIDGGYKDDWAKVVNLVTNTFKVPKINLVISSHTDADHIGGLPGVIENIPVDNLWMHLPWNHSDEINEAKSLSFASTRKPMTTWLKSSLEKSNDLATAALKAGIIPEEPFTGKQFITPYGTLTVLSPSLQYYEELLPLILTKSAERFQKQAGGALYQFQQQLLKAAESVASIFESHIIETLTDGGDTSPSNNSSTVLLLELIDGNKYLFTADAGMPALEAAYLQYILLGHSSGQLNFVQVPHHGSRRNVGPTILDKFLGQRTAIPGTIVGTAYVSVGETCDQDGHPKKIATNAFKRRGYPVYQTRGVSMKFGNELDGYTVDSTPLPHFDKVEKDD